MSEFGSGVSLNEDWDFEVDPTGDLVSSIGVDELEKDVAFNVARNTGELEGRRLDNTTEKRISIIVEDSLSEDVRISSVISVNVRRIDERDTFEVIAEVNAATGGTFELVFEV